MKTTNRRYSLFAMLAISSTVILLAGGPPYSIAISTPKNIVKLGSESPNEVTTRNTSNHNIDLPRSPRVDLAEQGNDLAVTDEKGVAAPETKYYRVLRGRDTYD